MGQNSSAMAVVYELVKAKLKWPDDEELDVDKDLKELGLDSMTAIDLLLEVEQALDVVIPDELLIPENLSNARLYANMVDRHCRSLEQD